MCLLTRQIKPITTKKDLVVHKELNVSINCYNIKTYYSKYNSFRWTINELATVKLDIRKQLPSQVGCHDDIDWTFYKGKNNKQPNRKLTVIYAGFHAYLTRKRALVKQTKGSINTDPKSLFKFLIPKGSLIFKDATGLIVSNQIIMLKP